MDKFVLDKFIIELPQKIYEQFCEEDETITLEKAFKKALLLEHKFAQKPNEDVYFVRHNSNNNYRSNGGNSNSNNNNQGNQKKTACSHCGWKNHMSKECKHKNSKCHKCSKTGHLGNI